MNPPTCKLCESRHWLDEGHKPTVALEAVRKVGADVLGHEKRIVVFPDPNPPESVTTTTDEPMVYVPTTVPTVSLQECECGKPREGRYKKCAACRKKAYRERSAK